MWYVTGKKWDLPSELDNLLFFLMLGMTIIITKLLRCIELKVCFYCASSVFSYGDKMINVNFLIELLPAFFFNG